MPDNVFEIVWLVGFVVGSTVRAIYTHGRRRCSVTASRQGGLDTALTLLSGVGLFVIPLVYVFTSWFDFADYGLSPIVSHAMGWTGALLFAGAVVLLWRSHVDLGRHWSPTVELREDHRLVTTGVYRRIRHPMYAAHWLWAVAQVLLLQNGVAGPALAVFFIPLYVLRVPREETMLLERFGEAYRGYMERTGRVFPRRSRGRCASGDAEG